MRTSLKGSCSFASIVMLSLSLACDDSTTPSQPGVSAAGNYTAVDFVTTGTSGQRNELQAGSTLVLNLNSNGTTSGHLHVAASASNPALDADMAGTWTQTGMIVDIDQAADTFVRNMPFELTIAPADGWDLVGDRGFSGTRVQVRLGRVY